MKTFITFLLLASLTLCISCDFGNDEDPKTELEKLPPITQTGENTFGCLVNGEALVAPHTLEITAIYQGGGIQLSGGEENKSYDKDITMVLNNPLEEGVTYSLINVPIHRAQYRTETSSNSCRYEYENTYEGSLIFSKIDRTNFIISGTFEFSTVTEGCDTIRITDGRFDVHYIP